ncbi:unnamed protein product [Camellia sinensis]
MGVLIWANGNRYEGNWEDGVPKGNGVFAWPDGSSYLGIWGDNLHNRQPEQPCFVLLPSRKRSSVDGGRGSLAERNANFSRICIWESDGEAGDITCDIVDNVEASIFYRDGIGVGVGSESPCGGAPAGQYFVGKHASITRALKLADFDPKEKFWTRFPTEGSKCTPPHQSVDFRWKDYCPMVFRHLREMFAIDPADYMLAICGSDALRELSSPGKSGCLFYLTQDDLFTIKTVKKSEVKGISFLESFLGCKNGVKAITALCPPKPNELEIAITNKE